MKKLVFTFLLLGALPSAAVAQSSDMLFLTCDTVRHYKIPDDGKTLSEKLYLKINTKTNIIYEFNADFILYENLCEPKAFASPEQKGAFWQWQGACTVSDDLLYLVTKRGGMTTVWKDLSIYRGSGRISGSVSLYWDLVIDLEKMMKATPLIKYDIVGVCQKSADMSTIEKAF